ncbi:uncharacterized protein A4U43_C04F24730 [Asparagus officinalis]|uniref:Uncharacterized protein n=1 Tax=Asparagus officinalis TaxID=4686 RepID=A0A5P1F445_ASPOF|nr:uncharacterized protein A4U43_C04F24730 [Asparagus officinalis]
MEKIRTSYLKLERVVEARQANIGGDLEEALKELLAKVAARLAEQGDVAKKKLEKKRRLDRGQGSSGAVGEIQVYSAASQL